MPPAGFMLTIAKAPAPLPLLEAVQEIEIDCSLEEASVLRIRFGVTQTATGDWSILDLDPFRPFLPLGVRIQRGLGPPFAVINAYVTEHHVSYGESAGTTVLEVTGVDGTVLMNLQEKVMPWPNMPDTAIATAIFGQYGLLPEADPTAPVLTEPEGTTVQRGTDIRFLRRLAHRNGFDCYVQPEPLSGLDIGRFQARSLVGIPDAVLSTNLGVETNLYDFRVHYELAKPTAALAAGLDGTTKSPQPALAPASLEVPLGLEPTLLRELPPGLVRPADTGLPRNPGLQRATQAIVDRSSWAVVAEGTVGLDVPVLRPGGLVNVRGAGRLYNGTYFVTRVNHRIAPGVYEQHFEARRNAVGMTGAELYVEVA